VARRLENQKPFFKPFVDFIGFFLSPHRTSRQKTSLAHFKKSCRKPGPAI